MVEVPHYKYLLDDAGEHIINIDFEDYQKEYTPQSDETIFNIADYGASEGVFDNSKCINDAIDAAYSSGGGVVKVAGRYKSAQIVMKSNVTLWVTAGSILKSLSMDEFNAKSIDYGRGFIVANGAENIKFVGAGTIDGNGMSFCKSPISKQKMRPLNPFSLKKYVVGFLSRLGQQRPGPLRPKLFRLQECKNIVFVGLILRDSAEWTVSLEDCENVQVESLVIDDNVRVANSDGIDVVCSKHVKINHVFISVGDDGIVLKSFKKNDRASSLVEDVEVTDAKIFSLANGFKIGSETMRDVKDVFVSDCDFFKCDTTGGYAGISIESCDGAHISNININNIRMRGEASALLIWLGERMRYEKQDVGGIRGINISDITAVDVDLPMAIMGVKHAGKVHNVEDVTLKNINVYYRECKQRLLIKKKPLESVMKGYPEIINASKIYFLPDYLNIFWDLPVYGLFTRYTNNIRLIDVKTNPRRCETARKEFNE